MSLNAQQKQFLQQFLQARPSTKDRLGGRQLTKIKGEYEKFCKERQKVDLLLSKLKAIPKGDVLAPSHEMTLKGITDRVDVASTTGDETVFKPAYKELAQIRQNLEEEIERRKKDIKAVDERAEKYKKELISALKEPTPNKKTQKLQSLKESIYTWLRDDHRGLDTAPVWAICEKVITAMGGPQKDDLNVAVNELDSVTWNLARDIRKAEDTGLDPAGYDTQVDKLRADLDKYIKAAENLGDVINLKRLRRMKEESTRLLFIVDPPPLSISSSQEDESDEQSSEEEIVLQPQQLQKPPEKKKPVSEEEHKTNVLKTVDSLLDLFETEYARIKKNYEDLSGQVAGLKNKTSSAKDQLEVDLKMLETVVADAKVKLKAGEQQLNIAKSARQEIEDGNGKWRDHGRNISAALRTGLGEFNTSEKMIGQLEGGLLYIDRSFESIQNLVQRVQKVDEELIEIVQKKPALLSQCSNNFTKQNPDELDMLKQLVFVSAWDDQKISTALGTATDQAKLDKVIKDLIEKPKHSSDAMTSTLAQCQQICIDADRFFGSQDDFGATLQQADKAKFDTIRNVAKLDVAKYTIPVIRPKKQPTGSNLPSVGVAVVGGGPIGLMAAVEARMSGASKVHVYEGRKDAYSRLNVLKIFGPQLQRFRSAGIFDAIFPNGAEPGKDYGLASVKTIEIALEDRCNALGIKLERGKSLKDVKRDDKGVVQLIFKGEEDKPKTCDVMILATGASITHADKYANEVRLSDTLGVPFQKSEVKDYATVGLFQTTAKGGDAVTGKADGWLYDFETDEVKYLVAQLTKEEFKAYSEDPTALRSRIIQDGQKIKMLDGKGNVPPPRVSTASKDETLEEKDLDAAFKPVWDQALKEVGVDDRFFGGNNLAKQEAFDRGKMRTLRLLKRTLNKKKAKNQTTKISPAELEAAVLTYINMEMGVTKFKMEFQQAQQFAFKDYAGVLVGDSAATPHPSTSKGLNTGVDEMGSVRDLVEDIEYGEGSEENREEAMRMYEWELKRRTDILSGQALEALQSGARERCENLAKKVWMLTKHAAVDFHATKKRIVEHTKAMSVLADSDEAKDDHDWKLREAAVKNIRAFEKQIDDAISKIEKIKQTKPTATKEELMVPFEAIFPKKV